MRITVQRGLFFGPSALVPEDLHSTIERGAALLSRARGARAAAPSSHRLRPVLRRLLAALDACPRGRVDAVVSGTGRIRLIASDTNKVSRIVAAQDVHGAVRQQVRLVGRSTGSSLAVACGWS